MSELIEYQWNFEQVERFEKLLAIPVIVFGALALVFFIYPDKWTNAGYVLPFLVPIFLARGALEGLIQKYKGATVQVSESTVTYEQPENKYKVSIPIADIENVRCSRLLLCPIVKVKLPNNSQLVFYWFRESESLYSELKNRVSGNKHL